MESFTESLNRLKDVHENEVRGECHASGWGSLGVSGVSGGRCLQPSPGPGQRAPTGHLPFLPGLGTLPFGPDRES